MVMGIIKSVVITVVITFIIAMVFWKILNED
jgi:hypothetical protein